MIFAFLTAILPGGPGLADALIHVILNQSHQVFFVRPICLITSTSTRQTAFVILEDISAVCCRYCH